MVRKRLPVLAVLVLCSALASETCAAQDGPEVELGVGFGQDFGGFGIQLGVLPIERLCVFGGAGILPGSRFGYNAGVQVIPVPAWKDALFACVMYGYHTVLNDQGEQWPGAAFQLVGVKSETGLDQLLFNGVSVGLGTRISTAGPNHWKLGIYMPLRSGEAQEVADDLDMMPITVSVGYHFGLD